MFDNRRDVELMRRIKEGDVDAFEELFNLYRNPIAKFFYHLCWDYQKTQDYLQEVFLRVWKGAPNFRATGKFSTYLFQIAKNFWLNEVARESRRIKPVSLTPSHEDAGPGEDIEDRRAGPVEHLLHGELEEKVREAVASLDDKKKVVFVLSEYQDMKYADIAEILEIPEGTVKSRMTAAERLLREKLDRYRVREDREAEDG
jgi:RNA polymerase sigma-70 factor (ECF subfamily)